MTYLKEILTEKIKLEYKYARSYWRKGVIDTALDLIDDIDGEDLLKVFLPSTRRERREILLGGYQDVKKYSYDGKMLCSNPKIAERYCTPSMLKKKKGGILEPNKKENWLDVQARAIYQAIALIDDATWKAKFEIENSTGGRMKKGDEMTEWYIRA